MPSLSQLNEAVLAFLAEFPDVTVTVVVDATFGHRIDKSEVKEFDTAIANNELVAPPAGAVGRGDAFVLGIADKAKASVLSNDSFQEFHGDYTWLFDDGRLVGGKPVPHVGWVFVDRVPVRGPVSRKATRESGDGGGRSGGRSRRGARTTARTGSKDASQPMPVPKSPPPGRGSPPSTDPSDDRADVSADEQPVKRSRRTSKKAAAAAASAPPASTHEQTPSERRPPAPSGGEVVNDLMPFLDFVEHHPVGTSVNAIVESYSSHGAYVRIGEVRGYVPLRLMSDPPPRSAREVMKVDDAVTLVVAAFAPARRSIDCAVPHMAVDLEPQDPMPVIEQTAADVTDSSAPAAPSGRRTRKAAATADGTIAEPARPARTKKAAATRAGATKASGTTRPAKKVAAKKAAATTPVAKKAVAKKTVATKAPAKKAAPKKTAPKKTAAKKTAAKKAAPKKTAPKKTAAKKTAAKKTGATKPPARRRSPGSRDEGASTE